MANEEHRSPNRYEYLHLTLEKIFRGTKQKLPVVNKIVCRRCEGSGCSKKKRSGNGYVSNMHFDDACHHCFGRKFEMDPFLVTVTVQRGAHHDQTFLFKWEGPEELNNKSRGHLIVVLKEIAHPVFERRGDDLHMEMELTPAEARHGFTKTVEGVDKEQILISSTGGTVDNETRRMDGKGMPVFGNPQSRGDLIITFRVKDPNDGNLVVAAADTEGHHKDGACGKDKYVETRSRSELVDLYGMNLGKWMSDDDE